MLRFARYPLAVLSLLLSMFTTLAADAPVAFTVASKFPSLSEGPLAQSILVTLPKGVVLRAGAVTVTEAQVTEQIAKYRKEIQPELERNRFFVMERMMTRRLLLDEARAWAKEQKRTEENDEKLLNAYLDMLAVKVTVTDEEVRAFFEKNKAELGGLTYEIASKDLRSYLVMEKQQELLDTHTLQIGARHNVEIDAGWLEKQAGTAMDNAVDRARRAGKPLLVEFSSVGCGACTEMAPVIIGIAEEVNKKALVVQVDANDDVILAERYGVEVVPLFIIYDREGVERYRHEGIISREALLKTWQENGLPK